MTKKSDPKFPQAGWAIPAGKRLKGWTASKVNAINAKRRAKKAA